MLPAIFIVTIFATIASVLPLVMTRDQNTRVATLHRTQANLSNFAGMEYSKTFSSQLDPPPVRDFSGHVFSFSKANNRINVHTQKGKAIARTSFYMKVPPPTCITIFYNNAYLHQKKILRGLKIALEDKSCDDILVGKITIIWSPDTNPANVINNIKIGNKIRNTTSLPSGSTFVLDPPLLLTSTKKVKINKITFNQTWEPASSPLIVQLNITDGAVIFEVPF